MHTRLHLRSTGRTALRRSALAVTAAMLLVACGSDAAQDSEQVERETEAPAATDAPAADAPAADDDASDDSAAVNPILNGVVPTLSGDQVDLASFAGQDVLVWVWAPW